MLLIGCWWEQNYAQDLSYGGLKVEEKCVFVSHPFRSSIHILKRPLLLYQGAYWGAHAPVVPPCARAWVGMASDLSITQQTY